MLFFNLSISTEYPCIKCSTGLNVQYYDGRKLGKCSFPVVNIGFNEIGGQYEKPDRLALPSVYVQWNTLWQEGGHGLSLIWSSCSEIGNVTDILYPSWKKQRARMGKGGGGVPPSPYNSCLDTGFLKGNLKHSTLCRHVLEYLYWAVCTLYLSFRNKVILLTFVQWASKVTATRIQGNVSKSSQLQNLSSLLNLSK